MIHISVFSFETISDGVVACNKLSSFLVDLSATVVLAQTPSQSVRIHGLTCKSLHNKP